MPDLGTADTSTEAVLELAGEYRPSMGADVVHAWARDARSLLLDLLREREETKGATGPTWVEITGAIDRAALEGFKEGRASRG
jgi:hypothetical protein